MVGAGFIAFTILNSILSLGATLTIVELAPRILPRMIDDTGAKLVEDWLTKHGVTIRTGARLARIEDAKGRKRHGWVLKSANATSIGTLGFATPLIEEGAAPSTPNVPPNVDALSLGVAEAVSPQEVTIGSPNVPTGDAATWEEL